ncbi:MAG: response regulator transcription factor [Chloroflexi bacterium]|mgnify:CR=1 FL=1|nr:response regulator transcription factor [Chloroflexota bacterium]
MSARTVLIVDDEERLRALVRTYLEREGYRVLTAANGREALRLTRSEKPDLIILDIMMPEMDGYEYVRQHRAESLPGAIIMLTARVDDADAVLGLELGADDYVTKPFSPRVLVARVRAVLRRANARPPGEQLLRAGQVVVDRAAHTVTVAGREVDLTPSEFDLLAVLVAAPGRVFTRAQLLEQVQGVAYEAYERTIDVHVKNLRAKLEDDPRDPRYIETVYGVGYRFAEQTEEA